MVGPKSKIFGQESTPKEIFFKQILRGMSDHQKLGVIIENKVVQKLNLENDVLPKNGLLNR